MRGRLIIAGTVVAGLAAVAVVVVLATSGGGKVKPAALGGEGPLHWIGSPTVFTHPTLKTDHIVAGWVRNDSVRPVRLLTKRDVKVVDAEGRVLKSAAVFSQVYGHGLFDTQSVPPSNLPEGELQRTGSVGAMAPGRKLPLTVSWRQQADAAAGARIEYPGGSLSLVKR